MTQPDGFPTLEDLHRCQLHLYDTPLDPAPIVSPAYTIIAQAGSGTFGDVYFCLPSPTITTAQDDSKAQVGLKLACNDLVKQLVAIKICQGSSIPTLCNELAVLQITATTNQAATGEATCESNTVGCDAFFLSLDHATCPSQDAQYFTTTTLPLVCTLNALLPKTQHLPEAFTWLLYIKIGKALEWLTKCCKPGIAHGDLHLGNILIGYPTFDPEECQQLPQVKIIDFGNSRIADAETGYEYAILYDQTVRGDKGAFLHLLAAMMGVMSFDRRSLSRSPRRSSRSGRGRGGAEFGEFRKCVQRAVKRSSWDHEDSVEELASRFRSVAERELKDVGEEECKSIWEAVMGITEEGRGAMLRRIEALVGVVTEDEK